MFINVPIFYPARFIAAKKQLYKCKYRGRTKYLNSAQEEGMHKIVML